MNTKSLRPVLKSFRRVMSNVIELDKELYMPAYFLLDAGEPLPSDTTIHTCGTAACVLGWAVLDKDFCELLDIDMARNPDTRIDKYYDWQLHESPMVLTMITGPDHYCRRKSFANAFPDVDYEQFKHLTIEDPTPDDVIVFIDWLLEVGLNKLETNDDPN